MTVYVDNMKAEFEPAHRPGRRYVMSHMIADSEEELHAMADRIGVARKWFQGDHYDITQSKKALAIAHGAKLIPMRRLAYMAVYRRMTGILPPEHLAEALMIRRIERRQAGC